MKLKVKRTEQIEVETEYELPVYLHFQDDDALFDELVKITEKHKITVKYDIFGLKIIVEPEQFNNLGNINIKHYLTSEEHFNSVYSEALKHLKNSVKKSK